MLSEPSAPSELGWLMWNSKSTWTSWTGRDGSPFGGAIGGLVRGKTVRIRSYSSSGAVRAQVRVKLEGRTRSFGPVHRNESGEIKLWLYPGPGGGTWVQIDEVRRYKGEEDLVLVVDADRMPEVMDAFLASRDSGDSMSGLTLAGHSDVRMQDGGAWVCGGCGAESGDLSVLEEVDCQALTRLDGF